MNVLMPTTLVGSLPQPDWLVRKDVMLASAPPRVRLKKIWRVEEHRSPRVYGSIQLTVGPAGRS